LETSSFNGLGTFWGFHKLGTGFVSRPAWARVKQTPLVNQPSRRCNYWPRGRPFTASWHGREQLPGAPDKENHAQATPKHLPLRGDVGFARNFESPSAGFLELYRSRPLPHRHHPSCREFAPDIPGLFSFSRSGRLTQIGQRVIRVSLLKYTPPMLLRQRAEVLVVGRLSGFCNESL